MPRKKTIKKRANNSGSIIKLSGTRRKPYAVRVTVGKNEDGLPIRKNLDYFENKQDAQDFLDMYNLMKRKKDRLSITDNQAKLIDQDLFEKIKNVQEQQKSMLTFSDIFWIIYNEKYIYLTSKSQKISWFNNFKSLHDLNINCITLFDLQNVIDNMKKDGRKEGTLSQMKVIACDIFEYAVIHQYIKRDNDFTSYIDVSIKNNIREVPKHHPFSINEIKQLIKDNSISSKMVLIYIFSGCRPVELYEINPNNIHIDVNCNDDGVERTISYMTAGSKTEAGKNRVIPIHNLIKPYIIELLEKHNDYLILKGDESKSLNQHFRNIYFDPLMDKLRMNHTPYDCRHTFSTLSELYKLDIFSVKRIMGHKCNDLTKDVYTHTLINRLYDEIQKIKV